MNEENKNLNEEEVTEEVETAEEIETAETTAETVETAETTEEAETAEEVETAEEAGTDEMAETTETAEAEDVKGSNKKVVTGVIIGIAVLIVAAIVVVFALFGKEWFNPYNKGHIDVTGRTVGEVADALGMEYEDFLAQYGLPEDMPKTTFESAASYAIPLSKYLEGNGMQFSEMAEYLGWDDSVTEDMTLGEALDKTKLSFYVGEENLASFKEEYGFGDEVTGDTLWGEVRPTVELKQKEENETLKEAEENAESDSEGDADAAVTEEPAADGSENAADAENAQVTEAVEAVPAE